MTINWVYQAYTPKKHDCGHQSLMLKSCFHREKNVTGLLLMRFVVIFT